MKKILILGFMCIFLLSGCGKFSADKAIKEFKDNVSKAKAYEIKALMEIVNDEDVYTYKVNVNFKKDDFYKVQLINQTNNHEQIILKNKEGVFVITPSLNKSFKFQSEWPKNSSQAYLLQSLLTDLENTKKVEMDSKGKEYILTADVNYPNNPDLLTEKIYFDKDMNLKKVEVLNEEGMTRIKVEFESINYKAIIDDKKFALDSIVDENCCNTDTNNKEKTTEEKNPKEDNKNNEKTTNKLDDIVYPLYVPANTYLTNKDTVSIPGGERVILTFAGEKNFILVEETANIPAEFEVIPVYGDPLMVNDSLAALSGNSLHWSSLKSDYYLTGDELTSKELMTIATSLSTNNSLKTDSVGK